MSLDERRLLEVVGKPLTPEQLAAVTAPMAPTVLVAGAGTGKTTVMAARVLWLVGTGQVEPGEVLGLTFTNKAAAELSARVRAGLRAAGLIGGLPALDVAGEPAEPGDEPSVLTYHAYAGRLLREHGLRIGVEPGARLLADATRFQLAARVLSRYDRPLHEVSHHLPTVIDQVLALDAELAEHLADTDAVRAHDRDLIERVDEWLAVHADATKTATEPNRVMRTAALRRLELLDLVDALRSERRRADTLDFSDQMRLAAELVRAAPPVVDQQRSTYKVVLLDEYQDTSVGQRVLLQMLFGGGHSVTAVGDPCQAIYGWRGASVRNIDQFPADFLRADGSPAARLSLTINNRSDEAVLDVANVLSEPLRAVHEGAAPLVARTDRRDAGRVVTALHATHADELAWIADRIAHLVHEDGVTPDDVAVLVRVSAEAAGLREALLERDVPVDVVGLGGLLDIPEVADVIATLEVLDDPTANPSLVRLLSGPRWRIGIRDLRLLGRRAAELAGGIRREVGDSDGDATDDERLRAALADAVAGVDPSEVLALVDAVEEPGRDLPFSSEARARFGAFAAELRELRRHQAEPAADLIGRIVARSGIGVEVTVRPHGDGGAALAQLSDIAAQFSDVDGGTGVRSFLAFTRAARRFDRGLEPPTDASVGGVKLLTAHKAKGLEFPIVFVPTLSEKVFPSERGRPSWTRSGFTVPAALRGDSDDRPELGGLDKDDHDALKDEDRAQAELEERRLAYVAVTRAERLLVLTGHWWGPTQVKPRGPSSYLVAAMEHCASADARTTVAVDAPPPDDGDPNPQVQDGVVFPWPAPLEPVAFARRRAVAAAVRAARGKDGGFVVPADPDERVLVESWDRDIESLLDEARALYEPVRDVRAPAALSATTSLRLMRDPAAFAADLARPMPRPPAPAASRGTRFHDWVERHFRERQLAFTDVVDVSDGATRAAPDLDDPEGAGDVPSSAADAELMRGDLGEFGDAGGLDEGDLAGLQAAFLAGPFGDRVPFLVETAFGVTIGGLVVRGRIDAVYREPGGGYLVVDWKTGTREPDPWQLAVYRLAFAELHDVPIDDVRAAFYTVPTGVVVEPDGLPGRAELELLLRHPSPPAAR